MVGLSLGLGLGFLLGGKPNIVSASLGTCAFADELSPFTGARTPPLPGFETSCPGGLPPSSRMTQRPQPAIVGYPQYIAGQVRSRFHYHPRRGDLRPREIAATAIVLGTHSGCDGW